MDLDPQPAAGVGSPTGTWSARAIGSTDRVPVELIVNGQCRSRGRRSSADGSVHGARLLRRARVDRSSAGSPLRVFPTSHTNPVFVEIDGRPVRASRRSAQWCLDSVDACWQQKSPAMRPDELAAGDAAYEAAREAYRRILEECEVD